MPGLCRSRRGWLAALLLLGSLLAAPLPAQIAGESPSAALSRHLRSLQAAPRSFQALVGAGRAALDLGDAQAAIGFYGRAEEVYPKHPTPKAGMGAALAAMGEPRAALGYFAESQRLGSHPVHFAVDRGLAYDLLGDQRRAQYDYRLALSGAQGDEARRRLALSQAIAGDRSGALTTLDPLLLRRDPAASRVRAFVLALTGDVAGARQVVEVAMPGSSARMEPFLRRLATLRADQKAAAVHFGRMPDSRMTSSAAPDQRPVAPSTRPVPAPPPARARVVPPEAAASRPDPRVAIRAPTAPVARTGPVVPDRDRLSDIDQFLSSAADVAPPPESRPKLESARVASRKAPAKEKTKPPTVPRRFWVQLAGGSRAERLAADFKRIKAKKPKLFAGKAAHVAEIKGWSRLLVGPFKSEDEGQEFVNDLAAAGIKSFTWTSPAGQSVDKLAAK